MDNEQLASLSDDELIALIEEAQRLLDTRHPLNQTALKCPQCGQEEEFRVEVYQWGDLDRYGASTDNDCDPAWGAESACNCPRCEYAGRLVDFTAPGESAR